MNLAYVRFIEKKLAETRCKDETAYHLCLDSIMVLDAIGWLMAIAGEWKHGVEWVKRVTFSVTGNF